MRITRISIEEFLPVSFPVGSPDAKLFIDVWNQGIDASLEAFTRSKHRVEDGRLHMNFHRSEIGTLLRRLREVGTEEAENWADDIEQASGWVPPVRSDRQKLAERMLETANES